MIKMVAHSTELTILGDLRRAAFVCIFQAGFYSIYMITVLYYRFYTLFSYQSHDSLAFSIMIVISTIQKPLYLFFVILDALVPMKSYRKSFKKVFKCLFRIVRIVTEQQISTVLTIKTPIIPLRTMGTLKSNEQTLRVSMK
jgi:hypothetical protein